MNKFSEQQVEAIRQAVELAPKNNLQLWNCRSIVRSRVFFRSIVSREMKKLIFHEIDYK